MYNPQRKQKNIELDNIFLNPNNPRLREEDLERISDDRITESRIQSDRMNRLNYEETKKSMQRYGFSKTDPVIVREFDEEKYVVLEGNRRIASAKELLDEHKAGELTLPPNILSSLEEVPVLVYEGEDGDVAWDLQAMRHLSGIKNWRLYSQAEFVAHLVDEEDEKFTSVGERAGMSAEKVGRLYRSYHAYKNMEEDDEYGDRADPSKMSFFEGAIFRRPGKGLREDWLEWSDDSMEFQNTENLRTFYSLILPGEEGEEPPIPRAMDVRDKLTKLWDASEQDKDLFRDVCSGEKALDEATTELAERRTRREEEERTITTEDIKEVAKKLGNYIEKLPAFELAAKSDEIISDLREIRDKINTIIEGVGGTSE